MQAIVTPRVNPSAFWRARRQASTEPVTREPRQTRLGGFIANRLHSAWLGCTGLGWAELN